MLNVSESIMNQMHHSSALGVVQSFFFFAPTFRFCCIIVIMGKLFKFGRCKVILKRKSKE